MYHFSVRRFLGGFAAMLVATAPIVAHAMPINLAPGSGYRIAFVTSGATGAQSSNIATYNAFVTVQAGLSTNTSSADAWSVIASTATVNAINNIKCAINCDDLPIYDVNGNLIASNAAGLFSGTLQNALRTTQYGATLVNGAVWTGTASNGLALSGQELGNASQTALLGLSDRTNGSYLQYSAGAYTGATFALYAISDEVFVPTVVSEPATLALLGIGAVMVTIRRRRGTV